MTSTIRVLGPGDLAQLPAGDGALRYLAALVRDGAQTYVGNARAHARIALVDDIPVPLIAADGAAGNTDVCSPFSHYVAYSLDELARLRRVPPPLRAAITATARAVLRLCELERVLFVNNWLWTTNPTLPLTPAQLEALTRHLLRHEPRAALVVRSVNPWVDPAGADALEQSGYRLVRARRVYVLDPRDGHHLAHANVRRDLELLKRTPYTVVCDGAALSSHLPRMADLYREVYVEKHSRLNPDLTERFFALTLAEGVLDYQALVRDGRVDAFFAGYARGDVFTAPLVGYDQLVPRSVGLYRSIAALIIDEARTRGLRLNMSGGVERFKLLRGAEPVEEFDAVYDRHLPARRRMAWTALASLGRLGAARPLDAPPPLTPRASPRAGSSPEIPRRSPR